MSPASMVTLLRAWNYRWEVLAGMREGEGEGGSVVFYHLMEQIHCTRKGIRRRVIFGMVARGRIFFFLCNFSFEEEESLLRHSWREGYSWLRNTGMFLDVWNECLKCECILGFVLCKFWGWNLSLRGRWCESWLEDIRMFLHILNCCSNSSVSVDFLKY